ncbi:hypothetical protein DSUL_20516 [Desulfovibrionales bacterium]
MCICSKKYRLALEAGQYFFLDDEGTVKVSDLFFFPCLP